MTDKTIDRLFNALWLGTGALLVGLILAAPVMREPNKPHCDYQISGTTGTASFNRDCVREASE